MKKQSQPLKKRKHRRRFLMLFLGGILMTFSGFLLAIHLSDPPSLEVKQTTILYTHTGDILGQHTYGQNRSWVPLSEISPYIIQGTLAIEDQNFYTHHGFDYKRIFAALLVDLRHMSKVQGASTITQQYARNLYLTHEKTWKRKLKEAYYTLRLEVKYDKDTLLEGYLNTIYYGHGMYGVEAASLHYFGKSAKDLTLSEAAYLIGIPKNPSLYTPIEQPEAANKRKAVVLYAMEKKNLITANEKKEALAQVYVPKQITKTKHPNDFAPYFQDMVMKEAAKILHVSTEEISKYGLRIYTTLDRNIQENLEHVAKQQMPNNSEVQLAIMSMDPKTGAVKGLIGGKDYATSPFNRATQAKRQPGSTIKPILYYAALENGFTPATTMKSTDTAFTLEHEQTVYRPANFNHAYADDFITMALAMAVSDNIYAVKTHLSLGMGTLVQTAKKMGIQSEMQAVPSLALGSSPTSMSEMLNAYALLANGGKTVQPTYIQTIVSHDGKLLYSKQTEKKQTQILNPQNAFLTTHMMTGMFDSSLNGYMRVTGDSIAHLLTRPYAGKSGSTDTDAWMIGFTPSLLTGVWIGYDRDHLLDKPTEKLLARNIWIDIMEKSLAYTPIETFEPPKGVTGAWIDPKTGQLATDACPQRRFVYFKTQDVPTTICNSHPELPKQKQTEPNKSWLTPWKKWFPF